MERQTLTVAQLNRSVRLGLEEHWADVLVLGEISDLTRASSGHVYFTLNDETQAAQLRVVLFKSDARRTRATLESGARVCVRGSLTLYEARGTYQFQARAVMPAGEGDLAAQLRRLLEKLTAEGLTDPARKRPLPLLPRCIGLVTSEHGAALHDVLRVARERCPVRIVVAHCVVQGADAPRSILRALAGIQCVPELDVVIVARGGGSAEDLWAFNDEAVARAIAGCRVPVVSGIGHEIDSTLTDFVADVRAATPSNAAELVVPMRSDLERRLESLTRMLARTVEARIARQRQALARAGSKLRDPRRLLNRTAQRIDELDARLVRAIHARIQTAQLALDGPRLKLSPHDPRARLARQRAQLSRLSTRIELSSKRWLAPRRGLVDELVSRHRRALEERFSGHRHRLASRIAQLDALSPLSVLARGYAIALSERTGRALLDPSDARPDDRLRIKLHAGEVHAEVIE
ncbi:MAG: exodeoxyribonuclease large subunit [Myxococcaceae bacterium]|nr:exodeoxyribonuclease large subunit [Myxococcaceae bacterium]